MTSIKEILNRQPPEVLYHYTTQQGLLGIITQKEIWATHTQYLNDAREFRHAIEIVEDELRQMKLDPSHRDNAQMLEWMENDIRGMESVNVCVSCFSEDGDSLSQWRAYGRGASGFSIGFAGQFLRDISDELEFWLVPVVYEEDQQRALVRGLLGDVITENLAKPKSELGRHPRSGNLTAYLNRYAPILKHKSFSEEREWRIISQPLACLSDGFDYRPGASMLIPYFRISLSTQRTPFRLSSLIVGPTPHPTEARRSVWSLLLKHAPVERGSDVRHSETPYRNW